MAIHDQNETTTQTSQASVFENNHKPKATVSATMHEPAAAAPSLRSGFAFASPIGKGMGNEYMNKIAESLREIYKSADPKYKVNVLTIDNTNEQGSYFSVILVCMETTTNANLVAVHPMIVEATANPIPPIYENYNGEQIEIVRTPGQALDDKLAFLITNKVKTAYNGRNVVLIQGEVIPRDFNPEDKMSMHMLALNSGFACGTELAHADKNFADLDLTKESRDSTLVVNIGFMPNQIKNVMSEPMRSDVLVQFSSQRKNAGNQSSSVNSGDRDIKISELSAFIDLVWNPAIPQTPMGYYAQPTQLPAGVLPTQKYNARAVITNLAAENAYTPASLLLAFSMISTLATDNNWMQAFRPQAVAGDIDFHDIGALNIEANIYNETDKGGFGSRIDTKSSNFTLQNLGQYISSIVGAGLIISMGCPEAGPQTWYQALFSMAERGNQSAIADIIDSANVLTGGKFGRYFVPNTPIFTDLNNIVHMGYWTDKTNQRRDIRDVDTIFVANVIGDRNPLMIRDWQDTFLRTEYPLNKRLAARKKMITGFTNETAVITGFARRVTFSAAFLNALNQSIIETGLAFRINTPLSSADMQNNRGSASFAGSALLMPAHSFISQGYSMPQSNSGNYNFNGRFGY